MSCARKGLGRLSQPPGPALSIDARFWYGVLHGGVQSTKSSFSLAVDSATSNGFAAKSNQCYSFHRGTALSERREFPVPD
ncbi:hypothetical protein DPMN_095679 [Dreissena polymorpha]|uniref:Uncharacterized protein n=1 Tax=Dreissena polymorpha TaxID=45954 RepID=A0A9D4R423_DREPO|nr:hypothetical protein DPMN_095679 [Dreissena polymorpha]